MHLQTGKVPNELMERFFRSLSTKDEAVIIGPGIGEDVAALDVRGEEVVVLKSDPITFTADNIAEYAVLVNANDIATSGANPRWMLATLLLPPRVETETVEELLAELHRVCSRYDITLCGGHTEVTEAVVQPVVCGTLAGTVGRDELVEKSRAAPGDNLLITKGIAVEGTAILAHDLSDRLLRAGIPEQILEKGRQFINDIAILKEAELAANTGMVTAMHDVTEGGFATAVKELSKAAGKRLRVDMELLPIYPETQQICTHLGIDPLGLIGSGSLLMCCKPEGVSGLINRLAQENINAIVIGEVLEEGTGVEAFRNGHPVTLPEFAVDEIATVL